jgi:hypothetical protein
MKSPKIFKSVFVLLLLFSTKIFAGLIDVNAYEYKGEVTVASGHTEFKSYMKGTLVGPEWGAREGYTEERRNREVFVIDHTETYHFWNVYPDTIEVIQPPQPNDNITIPFLMGTSTGTGFDETIGSLPLGSTVESAEMEDGYGNWHPGTFSSFFDIFFELTLPTTGPNGETYSWDFDKLSKEPVSFRLYYVTMTIDEFTVPEPASLVLFAAGCLFLRKR